MQLLYTKFENFFMWSVFAAKSTAVTACQIVLGNPLHIVRCLLGRVQCLCIARIVYVKLLRWGPKLRIRVRKNTSYWSRNDFKVCISNVPFDSSGHEFMLHFETLDETARQFSNKFWFYIRINISNKPLKARAAKLNRQGEFLFWKEN